MRLLVNVTCPIEPFNSLVRNGTAGEVIERCMDEIKPEQVYFSEHNGHRGCTMVVNVKNESEIPRIAEPWFLNFNASCEFRIAMTKEDLMKANLSQYAEKTKEAQLN